MKIITSNEMKKVAAGEDYILVRVIDPNGKIVRDAFGNWIMV